MPRYLVTLTRVPGVKNATLPARWSYRATLHAVSAQRAVDDALAYALRDGALNALDAQHVESVVRRLPDAS